MIISDVSSFFFQFILYAMHGINMKQLQFLTLLFINKNILGNNKIRGGAIN